VRELRPCHRGDRKSYWRSCNARAALGMHLDKSYEFAFKNNEGCGLISVGDNGDGNSDDSGDSNDGCEKVYKYAMQTYISLGRAGCTIMVGHVQSDIRVKIESDLSGVLGANWSTRVDFAGSISSQCWCRSHGYQDPFPSFIFLPALTFFITLLQHTI
jgi:hypothetical protein